MTIKNFNYVVGFIFLILIFTPPILNAVTHNIDIVNFAFTPLKTTVVFGDTVRWTLQQGVHTTTSDAFSPKTWDSGTMTTIGHFFEIVITASDGGGPFPYRCSIHPTTMKDTILVDSCAGQNPGDANSDGLIAVGDISYLISYLYSGGPMPNPLANGDPNGDCCIDTFDILYITDFLFSGGPAPVLCTCVNPPVCIDTCAGQMPGDINSDGAVNSADLAQLLSYLVSGGVGSTGPDWDVDGDCYISGSDLTYLKLFLFAGGPPPVICTCLNPQYTGCYPGDADNSLELDISDAVYIIEYIFNGGPAPVPFATCSGDADCLGSVDISDAVYLVNLIFGGGPFPCSSGIWIDQYGPPF